MNFRIRLFFLIACLSSTEIFAYTPQEGNITATLGPFFYKADFRSKGTDINAPVKGDLGILTNGDFNQEGALEVGIFRIRKNYYREESFRYFAEESALVHVTMGYRRYFSPLWSGSIAFFSSYTMGYRSTFYSDFPTGQEPTTSASDITEYGFDFALQREVWTQDTFSVVIDGRYSYSLTPKLNEQSNHFGLMIGLRFPVQEKEPHQAPN
jgi:hypothetical protein